jgi:hypothetical protein
MAFNHQNTLADKELCVTSIHEARHVVVACLLGVPFRRVTVIPDRRFAGHVTVYRKKPPSHVYPWNNAWNAAGAREYWTRHICAILAGSLAETLNTQHWCEQSRSDEYEVQKISDYFYLDPPTKRARWVNRLRFETLETLRTPEVWAAVRAVALALVKRSTLKGAEVRALVHVFLAPSVRKSHG